MKNMVALFDDFIFPTLSRIRDCEEPDVCRRHVHKRNCGMIEEDDHYLLMIDVPGVEAKDLDIEVRDSMLSVKSTQDKKTNECRNLRAYHFAYTLPRDVNVDATEVELKNGVLSFRIPKSEEYQPKRIKITEA